MAINISAIGAVLKVLEDSNAANYANMNGAYPSIIGGNVAINDCNGNVIINRPFADYTVPSGASAVIVADAIAALIV